MSQQGKGPYKYSNRELIFLHLFFQINLVSMKTCMHLERFSFARYLLFTSRLSTKVSDLITKLVRSATFDWLTFHFSHGKTSQSELYWTRLAHATNTKSYKLNALGSRTGDEKWSLRIQESLLLMMQSQHWNDFKFFNTPDWYKQPLILNHLIISNGIQHFSKTSNMRSKEHLSQKLKLRLDEDYCINHGDFGNPVTRRLCSSNASWSLPTASKTPSKQWAIV